MENRYIVTFKNVNKKVIKKYRVMSEKNIYGVYAAQEIITNLQKGLSGIEKITVAVANSMTGQMLEFDDVYIDPYGPPVQLLDVLQKQLLDAGDQIDGAQIYTELNRQFNNEMDVAPQSVQKSRNTSPLIKAIKGLFIKDVPLTASGYPPYEQPFMGPNSIVSSQPYIGQEATTEAQPVAVPDNKNDYIMIFNFSDGSVLESSFQSEMKDLNRNSALQNYFSLRGRNIQIDNDEYDITKISSITLEKVDISSLFNIPSGNEYDAVLSAIPE